MTNKDKDKVVVEIIVKNKHHHKKRRQSQTKVEINKKVKKLTDYQKFTKNFIKTTKGDMNSSAKAWNQIKKQAKGKPFVVNFTKNN